MPERNLERSLDAQRETCRLAAKAIFAGRGYAFLSDKLSDDGVLCEFRGLKVSGTNKELLEITYDLRDGSMVQEEVFPYQP